MTNQIAGIKAAPGAAVIFFSLLTITAISTAHGQPDSEPIRPEPVEELEPGFIRGYLETQRVDFGRGIALAADLPDSALLIPPPPQPGSVAFEHDQERIRAAVSLQDSPRKTLALADDSLAFPAATHIFECSLGIPITDSETPFLYQLLRRTLTDAAISTFPAKYKFDRKRPFQINGGETGLSEAQVNRLSPAYPSAHSAIGWTWALILSSIAPERSNAILARGLAFGESRAVLNLHWHSDITWGRLLASTVVAQLYANETFRHDFVKAKHEFTKVSQTSTSLAVDCEAENEALAAGAP